jgi:hypothetical protein
MIEIVATLIFFLRMYNVMALIDKRNADFYPVSFKTNKACLTR